ncbi:hypothetical protein [Streptomyces sp. NPDC053560]|uniref:hypothetical protein n=1 Tax=Streptomyces sp. NPDC053560 TaxID=3365711 RepID=UPI0037D91DA9
MKDSETSMTIQASQMLDILRNVCANDPQLREYGADTVTDLVGSYSRTEVQILAGVLSLCASSEENYETLEAQLHAILELGSTGLLSVDNIQRLREIDRAKIPVELSDYIDDLLQN